MKCRSAVTAAIAVMVARLAVAAHLPNYDALSDAPRVEAASTQRAAALSATASVRVQWDDRFGVPTFVWPAPVRAVAAMNAVRLSPSNEDAARGFLSQYAALYGLNAADISDAYVAAVHDTGRGAIVVKLRQTIGGIPVFRDEVNVVLNRDRDLVALSGHIAPLPHSTHIAAASASASPFLLTAPAAIAAADQTVDVNALRSVGRGEGGYEKYAGASNVPIRTRRLYFHLPDRYEPAYYVEVRGDDTVYGMIVSAIDGRLLLRKDLSADATGTSYGYRVWANPDGEQLPFAGPQGYDGTPNPTASTDGYQPFFILPNFLNVVHGPISTGDPWLPPSAFETVGNNVDAYVDLFPPDGLSAGDFRATTSGGTFFDRTYDVTLDPYSSEDQQMAAITQLFYDVNFLHDWYYDAGFTEAAGNAQSDNLGRGGFGGDPILAEAQDYSGRNNANMLTPPDGESPRMQMYVWDSAGNRTLRVESPTSIAKPYMTGVAVFGPQSFDITGDVVRTTPSNACSDITSSVAGKIAFVDRGDCTFLFKTQRARAAGAIGVIIGNVLTSPSPNVQASMGCTDCDDADNLPPAMNVALPDANAFRTALAGSGMRASLHREPAVDRDGTIDNQIVAHEWMHYLTNRLVGDGLGLVSSQSRGLGEGWSDFNALLMSVRPEDTRFSSNALFDGAYAVAVYATTGGSNGPLINNGTYFGIRRVPYSTDRTKNPLTLRHLTNGVEITGAPVRYGSDGAENAEVHSTGEVWCNMLWEAYASMLRDTLGATPRLTFAQAQKRMREYLVASLKITPTDPTILEARDALLATALATDRIDYQRFWEAFGKRGAGLNAIAPERYSDANNGAVEDFNGSGGMAIVSVTIGDSTTACLRDGLLGNGETGAIRIALRNIGGVSLQSTTVEAHSSDSALSFTNGGVASVPPSNPGETVTAVLGGALAAGLTSVLNTDLSIVVRDPQIPLADGMSFTYPARLNAVEAPKESATDDVEAATSAWTRIGTAAVTWNRVAVTERDHRWLAPEPNAAADISLVSPMLVVGSTGDFKFSFRHRFALDFYVVAFPQYVDGGVIEISADQGKTWTDLGERIDPSTTHYASDGEIILQNGSAIEGRKSFAGYSPGFDKSRPSISPFTTTVVNLGTDYAGKRVQVRFRFVTGVQHSFATRTGWEIDDIAFENILNLPFAVIVGDRGGCGGAAATTTMLTTSATKLMPQQTVVFSAAVTSQQPTTGTVDFYDNGAILGTARIDSGVARFTASSLSFGPHTITATFNGGKYFTASTATPLLVQVGAAPRRRSVR